MMMSRQRKLLIGTMASAAMVGSGLLVPAVFAKAAGPSDTSLISEIAAKFNLKTADVQAVFDQHRSEQEATWTAKVTAKLDQAVADGNLTSAQRDLIVAKQKEMKAAMEANRSSDSTQTNAERKTAREKEMTELKQWASDNSIDMKWLRMGGHGGPGGPGHGGPRGDMAPPTEDSSSSTTSS